jgi:anti-sigma B factor antagonist
VTDLASLFFWRRDGVMVAAITGEIDISNARELEAAILGELDGDTGLVLDLGGLSFLDGSGVHLLTRLEDQMLGHGLGFAVVVSEDTPPRRVLRLSGPRPGRWVHPSEDAAVAAARS